MLNQKHKPLKSDVVVHGRAFLAGSNHNAVPLSIPDGRETLSHLNYDLTKDEITQPSLQVKADIRKKLAQFGAVIVRVNHVTVSDDFSNFVGGLGFKNIDFKGGIAVRDNKSNKAVIASQEDKRITLAPHNEMSYLPKFPRHIFFFCEVAAPLGGEVPINDIRLTKGLIPTDLAEKFRKLGVRYTRHLPTETVGAHLNWADTFGETDKSSVEAYLTDSGFDFEWDKDDNLSYSYVSPAFMSCPETGQELWFNQITELHSSYWRDHPGFASDLSDTSYPATTSFGNGDVIELDVIHMLRALLWQTAYAVKMRPGDMLILDNQFMQHGRFSYEGERKHFVKMTG